MWYRFVRIRVCLPQPGPGDMTTLNREIETYNRLLPELLAQQGKFVLIKGDEQFGTFDSYNDALAAGYDKFKLEPFLVRQIAATEFVAYFTRDVDAVCRT
jgi:hypothetical protein